jgi:hypothetical protein
VFQIKRAISKKPEQSFDLVILADSRGRQIGGGAETPRDFSLGGFRFLDGSLVARQFSDYITIWPMLRPYLRKKGTVVLLTSIHSLGSRDTGDVVKLWRETATWNYLKSYSTTVESGHILFEAIYSNFLTPDSTPSSSPRTTEEATRDAQSVQLNRANALKESSDIQQIRTEIKSFVDSIDPDFQVLVINLPLHSNLLRQIRGSERLTHLYNGYRALVREEFRGLDLQLGPCEVHYFDGVHYTPESIRCLSEAMLFAVSTPQFKIKPDTH